MTRKKLSDDDTKVWDKVTETITPLKDRPKPADLPKGRYFIKDDSNDPLPADWFQGSFSAPRPTLDKHNKRQIRTSKRPIERTLDLHGMTQDQAYSALKNCLERSVRDEMRTIIVVTGKGGKRWSQTGTSTIATRKREDFDQHGGVLKRMVPLWLASPDMAPFVHSYSEASKDHGGAGALYVLLRRPNRNKQDR